MERDASQLSLSFPTQLHHWDAFPQSSQKFPNQPESIPNGLVWSNPQQAGAVELFNTLTTGGLNQSLAFKSAVHRKPPPNPIDKLLSGRWSVD